MDRSGPGAPLLDKLSALIAAMNDKYGLDLGEGDKVWIDQQWVVVRADDDMRTVAENNDRSQYELVPAERIKEFSSSATTPTARCSTLSPSIRTSRA